MRIKCVCLHRLIRGNITASQSVIYHARLFAEAVTIRNPLETKTRVLPARNKYAERNKIQGPRWVTSFLTSSISLRPIHVCGFHNLVLQNILKTSQKFATSNSYRTASFKTRTIYFNVTKKNWDGKISIKISLGKNLRNGCTNFRSPIGTKWNYFAYNMQIKTHVSRCVTCV